MQRIVTALLFAGCFARPAWAQKEILVNMEKAPLPVGEVRVCEVFDARPDTSLSWGLVFKGGFNRLVEARPQAGLTTARAVQYFFYGNGGGYTGMRRRVALRLTHIGVAEELPAAKLERGEASVAGAFYFRTAAGRYYPITDFNLEEKYKGMDVTARHAPALARLLAQEATPVLEGAWLAQVDTTGPGISQAEAGAPAPFPPHFPAYPMLRGLLEDGLYPTFADLRNQTPVAAPYHLKAAGGDPLRFEPDGPHAPEGFALVEGHQVFLRAGSRYIPLVAHGDLFEARVSVRELRQSGTEPEENRYANQVDGGAIAAGVAGGLLGAAIYSAASGGGGAGDVPLQLDLRSGHFLSSRIHPTKPKLLEQATDTQTRLLLYSRTRREGGRLAGVVEILSDSGTVDDALPFELPLPGAQSLNVPAHTLLRIRYEGKEQASITSRPGQVSYVEASLEGSGQALFQVATEKEGSFYAKKYMPK